ncbi:MAG: EamA family transporter [Azospirillaceae bacterium]
MTQRHGTPGLELGRLYGAVFLLGGAPLFARVVDLPALDITALRAAFGALALAGLLVAMRETVRIGSRRDIVAMSLVGLLMTAHWVAYFHAIQVATVAVALIGFFTFPVFTVLLEPLFFRGARITPGNLASAGVTITGAVILVGGPAAGPTQWAGLGWGVVSAVLLAVRNLAVKRHLGAYGGTAVMFWQLIIVAIVLLPTLDWSVGPLAVLGGPRDGAALVLLGVVFTAGAHTLFVRSVIALPPRTVSIVFCLQPVVGVALAAVLLGERPSLEAIAGGALIILVAGYESVRAAAAIPKPTKSY